MKHTIGVISAVVILLLGTGLVDRIEAGTFKSFNGKFHFTYPETWNQVDYTTAEIYLRQGRSGAEVDFEAVFTETQSYRLFQGQYLILTVDTLGALSTDQIDSAVAELTSELDRPVVDVTPVEFLTGSVPDAISFDRDNGLVAVETEVPGGSAGPRINLLIKKFYEHGIANFYFYCPKAEFVPSLVTFRDVISSFAIGTASAGSTEEVRIADLDEDHDGDGIPVAVYAGVVAVLIAIIVSRKRSRARQDKAEA